MYVYRYGLLSSPDPRCLVAEKRHTVRVQYTILYYLYKYDMYIHVCRHITVYGFIQQLCILYYIVFVMCV